MNCQACKDLLFNYIDGHIKDRQKTALQNHLKDCRLCREEERALRSLQQRLTVHGQTIAETDLATGVLGAIMREQKKRLLANKSKTQAGRRSIMKSPIFKIGIAAAVIISGTVGLFMWSSTQSVALADVLTRIEQVRAYMYQMSMTMTTSSNLPTGQPRIQDSEGTILIAPEYGTKMTMLMSIDPNQDQRVTQEHYVQPQHKRMLMIIPDQNKYMEIALTDQLLEQHQKQSNDPRIMIDTMLKCDYQKIGKSRINGIDVEGFQTTDPAYTGGALGADVDVTLWVDSQTWLPVQVDMDMTIAMEDEVTMHMKGELTNFQWDVPVDASIFEPVIPEHYTTLAGGPIKMPDMNEETAINGLKVFLKYTGQYPKEMNMMAVMSEMRNIMDGNTPAGQDLKQSMQDLDKDAKGQALNNVMMPIMATVGFHAQLVQQKKDPAYYGHIVTPDTPDLILMRWRVTDNEYRVIFGDLTTETVTLQQLADLESALPQ